MCNAINPPSRIFAADPSTIVRATKIVRDSLRRIDSDESGGECHLEGRQTLGLRRYDLRVGRCDCALRRLHHGTLRDVAGRLRRIPGYVRNSRSG